MRLTLFTQHENDEASSIGVMLLRWLCIVLNSMDVKQMERLLRKDLHKVS